MGASDSRHAELHSRLAALGQDHVLAFWPSLTDVQRKQLLADIACINFAELPNLARLATHPTRHHTSANLAPAPVIPRSAVTPDVIERGRSLLAQGKAAAFTVAGGQGTRLGFDGPKGALRISPVQNKSLFQLFAESILGTNRRCGCRARWYIMTSPQNDAATREFFERNRCFGLAPDDVAFFQQGVMPAFDRYGKILLDEKHRLALSPDGHGGSLLALARNGLLADMTQRGIEHISYFQVDNPLVYCLDPAFLGLHDVRDSEMSSKTLPKADDLERVGNFVWADGKLTVIEYTDLPDSLAHAKNTDGSRMFDAANIAIHVLSRRFVERLTADPASFALPWHRADKKVPHVDLATGLRVEPTSPNGVKLESFVFDALPLAENPILLETSRAEEFSPVKNAAGVDSVETARRDMNRRAARWLESAGWQIPHTQDGEPDGTFEISPLTALDMDHLQSQKRTPQNVQPGDRVSLE